MFSLESERRIYADLGIGVSTVAAVSSVGGMVGLSRDDSDFAVMCNLLEFDVDGSADSFTNPDAVTGIDAFADLEAPTEIDACVTDLDADVDK